MQANNKLVIRKAGISKLSASDDIKNAIKDGSAGNIKEIDLSHNKIA